MAGCVAIGTRKADVARVAETSGAAVSEYEINDTATPTPEFYIACYPVTVAQFRAFVQATGFRVGDEDTLRDPDSRPVRYVSWHEALAYCDWLNEELASPNALDGGELAHLVPEHGLARYPAQPTRMGEGGAGRAEVYGLHLGRHA